MPDSQRPDDGRTQDLEAEIVRLNKVVEALMDRAETRTNVQGSHFGLFQTTIMLQDHVRLRTEELEAALRERPEGTSSARTAAGDLQTLRRTAALQIQLLELVVRQKDVAELVERVAAILDIPIVLFDGRGRVVCCSRSAAGADDLAVRLWAEYSDLPGRADSARTAVRPGERVFFRDVNVLDRTERVLAAVVSGGQPADLAGASLLFLQQLVTLDLLHSRDELRMRRRLRRGLLRDLLAANGTPEELKVRLQAQGFDEDSAMRIAVVEPQEPRPAPGGASDSPAPRRSGAPLLRALDDVLSRRRAPYLSVTMGPTAVVLSTLPDSETATARALLAELQEAAAAAVSPREVVVGGSAPLAGVASAPKGLKQAKAACMAARREPSSDSATVFEELSGHFRLLDGLDEKALHDIVQRTFAPLLDYDARHHASLYLTLSTLFDHHLAVQETADVLHIHRNTLQKRLAHVEQLLAIDLSALDDIVDIRLGLHAADLLGGRLP